MNIKAFSKKEAIAHGIEMVKKYWQVILLVMLIYVSFEICQSSLQQRAGQGYMKKNEIISLYKQPDARNNFYLYLQHEGYISTYGRVEDKLNNITDASSLTLPATLEGDRDKIFNFLQAYRYRLPFPKIIYYLLLIVFWIFSLLLSLGTTRISLIASRDQKPEVSELFSNGALLITYALSAICYTLAIMGGLVLFIVPGIIFTVALGMNQFFIIDQNMGPIEALNASRTLTKGVRWQLFCFGGLLILFNLAGLLCLGVGLLLTIPASSIAMAYVYDQLRLKNESAATAKLL